MKKIFIILILNFFVDGEAFAKCKKEDLENYVSTKKACIGIEPVGKKINKLIIKMEK